MNKTARNFCVLLVLTVIITSFAAVAFALGVEPVNTSIVSGDMYTAGQKVSNSGTVQGDIIAAGQDVSSSGSVEGDFLAAGMNVDLTGKVIGDMRSAGQNIIISGEAGKNITAAAQTISCKNSSIINGNILAFGNSIDISGIVKGKSTLYGNSITLGGQFLGDVDVYTGDSGKLTVLPNTTVQGKLTYTGGQAAEVSSQATVNSFDWSRPVIGAPSQTPAEPVWQTRLISFFGLLITTAVYFLLGLLIYKYFPTAFVNQAKFITEKPASAFAKGITMFALQFAFLIGFVILLVLSILLVSPSIAFALGFFVITFYTLLFYFSALPVALWLGNTILGQEKFSVIHRLGLGLLTIKVVMYLLGLLSDVFGPVGIVIFIVNFAILLVGSGTIIHSLKEVLGNVVKSQKSEPEPIIQE